MINVIRVKVLYRPFSLPGTPWAVWAKSRSSDYIDIARFESEALANRFAELLLEGLSSERAMAAL